MKLTLRLISYLGLALSVVSPVLYWAGQVPSSTNYTLLVVGMFLWFGTAIFWIKPEKHEA